MSAENGEAPVCGSSDAHYVMSAQARCHCYVSALLHGRGFARPRRMVALVPRLHGRGLARTDARGARFGPDCQIGSSTLLLIIYISLLYYSKHI